MQMLVTDLTRMRYGICVAGVDLATGTRVRPVLPNERQFQIDMTRHFGGPFDVRAVVELGSTTTSGQRPEVEDAPVTLSQIRQLSIMDSDEFLDRLPGYSSPSLPEAFGPELVPHSNGRSLVVPEGKGEASLAIVKAARPFEVRVEGSQVRARWPHNGRDLSVTDLRLFKNDGATVDGAQVNRLATRLRTHFAQGRPVYAAFGLGRAWVPEHAVDRTKYHWLQVNSIHLDGARKWRLPKPDEESDEE
ncbi:MAG: hypothetical protein R3C29_15470 [Dehalococcoidia bacterium]